ncbi:MAG: NADH-quinone oxidoreductase subunit NuoE [Alphaproteobacteria bacterium]|nr:NADH-quinone oxidoreductase subunit NuoE [Alphaproteobacteria bacterium]
MSSPSRKSDFSFTPENLKKAQETIAKYPAGRQQSAVMPLLHLAQQQNANSLTVPIMDCIADMLGMPYIKVYEVATFYTMYNHKPMGRHHVQVCTTTPCWLRGSDEVLNACKSHLKVEVGGTTKDGMFTLSEAECLGACVNAPVVWIGKDYFEDLNAERMEALLKDIQAGKKVRPGPQIERQASAPAGGLTSLTSFVKESQKKAAAPATEAKAAPAKKTAAKKKPAKKKEDK